MEVGGIVEGEVGAGGLFVDEVEDVVLDEFSLDGADVAGGGGEQFAEQQGGRKQGRGDQSRFPLAGFDRGKQRIDGAARQQDDEDGDESLDEEKCGPGESPAPCRAADQRNGGGQMPELADESVEAFPQQGCGGFAQTLDSSSENRVSESKLRNRWTCSILPFNSVLI